MRITKYPQSCLKIEKNGRTVIVDLGTLATAKYKLEDFGKVDAVIFTHRHTDHLDVDAAKEFLAGGVSVYGNGDVAKALEGKSVEVIDDEEELVIAGIKFKAFDMPHCLMVDGSEGSTNTGFLVEDTFLLPGDSVEAPRKLKASAVAVPVFGPDISLHDAYLLLEAIQARVAIPVHYDVANLNPQVFELLGGKYHPDMQIRILEDEESTELA